MFLGLLSVEGRLFASSRLIPSHLGAGGFGWVECTVCNWFLELVFYGCMAVTVLRLGIFLIVGYLR